MCLLLVVNQDRWSLPDNSAELPPRNDISDDAGHAQNVRINFIHLQDDCAILTEALKYRGLDHPVNNALT